MHDNRQKQVKFAANFKAGSRVLELGSGAGDFLSICRERGIAAVGVDKDSSLSAAEQKKYGVIKADAVKYLGKKAKAQFDGVYARHFVEHFEPAQLKLLFKAVEARLNESGLFIIIFPNLRNVNVATYEFWNDVTHVRPYPSEALKGLIEKSAMTVIKEGPDFESWDNSFIKNLGRTMRSYLTGIPAQPPDYYMIAQKGKRKC